MFRYLIVQIFVTLIECNNDNEFCANNYIDSVLFYGYKYRITQNEFIGDYNHTNARIENFQKLENRVNEKKMYYQSVYSTNHKSDYNRGTHGIVFSVTINAYDSISGVQYHQTFLGNATYLDKITLKDIYNSVFHDDRSESAKNYTKSMRWTHQKHKPSTFWPKFDFELFVFNSNRELFNFSKNAKLVIKERGNAKYQFFDLIDSEDKIYTAMFWWNASDEIYAVIEHRNESPRNGYMYRFNYKNTSDFANSFIPMNIKVNTFFGCNDDEDNKENNEENRKKETSKLKIYILLLANCFLIVVLISELLIICLMLTRSGKSKAKLRLIAGRNLKQDNPEVKTEAKEKTNVFDLERLKRWRRITKSSEKEIDAKSKSQISNQVSTGFEPTGQHSKI